MMDSMCLFDVGLQSLVDIKDFGNKLDMEKSMV